MDYKKRRATVIREAINEARRFISRAEEAIDAMEKPDVYDSYFYWNKPHAAMKRSSMDLTNMLVKLRKPL